MDPLVTVAIVVGVLVIGFLLLVLLQRRRRHGGMKVTSSGTGRGAGEESGGE